MTNQSHKNSRFFSHLPLSLTFLSKSHINSESVFRYSLLSLNWKIYISCFKCLFPKSRQKRKNRGIFEIWDQAATAVSIPMLYYNIHTYSLWCIPGQECSFSLPPASIVLMKYLVCWKSQVKTRFSSPSFRNVLLLPLHILDIQIAYNLVSNIENYM